MAFHLMDKYLDIGSVPFFPSYSSTSLLVLQSTVVKSSRLIKSHHLESEAESPEATELRPSIRMEHGILMFEGLFLYKLN
jgi:hypothetical protein